MREIVKGCESAREGSQESMGRVIREKILQKGMAFRAENMKFSREK